MRKIKVIVLIVLVVVSGCAWKRVDSGVLDPGKEIANNSETIKSVDIYKKMRPDWYFGVAKKLDDEEFNKVFQKMVLKFLEISKKRKLRCESGRVRYRSEDEKYIFYNVWCDRFRKVEF